MSGVLGDLLGTMVNSALTGQQGGSSAGGGLLGSLLGGSGGGVGGMLGGLLGGGGQQQTSAQSGLDSHQVGGMSLAALLPIAMTLIQQSGGIEAVLNKFRQSGYTQQADSWQSTGANEPVHGDALHDVFGGQLGQVASQFGVDGKQAAGGLASMLPELLNQLTPQGKVEPGHENVVGSLLGMLTKG